MRYIDKYRMHAAARAINVRFLQDCYRNDINNPIPSPAHPKLSYDDFKKSSYRDGVSGWKNLLLEEQKSEGHARCCYCMRRLNPSKGKMNYEHIIPRSLSGADGQAQYRYYSSKAQALRDHVIMADDFVTKTFNAVSDINNEIRMPHITGLSNLVVACNGKRDSCVTTGCCCNGNREDDKIMPIMLMQNADTDVKYDENGILTISCNDGTLDKIIKELNEITLQEIRSVWYHLSRVNKDVAHAETMPKIERANWFKEAYKKSSFIDIPEEAKRYSCVLDNTEADTYWHLLLAYDWFYYYPGYARQRATA